MITLLVVVWGLGVFYFGAQMIMISAVVGGDWRAVMGVGVVVLIWPLVFIGGWVFVGWYWCNQNIGQDWKAY